jgi:di/tricarboxylate transporter
MTTDQWLVVGLLGCVLTLLIWGRWRYDAVAFAALMVAVATGIVPKQDAFSGFAHSATVIVALVLIVSAGLASSGVVGRLALTVGRFGQRLTTHLGVIGTLGAALSAVMNNVGALALLMPVDIEAARKAKRSPALTLMPLSFATILGGLVTLIGTPPNLIISAYREQALGEPYRMFDFAPVGIVCALAGVAFVTLIGWRLISHRGEDVADDVGRPMLQDFVAELSIGEESSFAGMAVAEIEKELRGFDVTLLSVVRNHLRLPDHAGWLKLEVGDVLVVETGAEDLGRVVKDRHLNFISKDRHRELLEGAKLELIECVVRPGSRLEGRTSAAMHLVDRYNVWLVGISRQGKSLRSRVRRTAIAAGDVLLIMAPQDRSKEFLETFDVLPLSERDVEKGSRKKAMIAGVTFAAAITIASLGFIDLSIALGIVALLYLALGVLSPSKVYQSVEWPVVVLIGSLIPLGTALETSGVTELFASSVVAMGEGLPGWVILTILMALTMTLSDALNNTATAVIGAPIALNIANALNVSPDPFLMAVAIAASCAFLTPIGHKNNTLIMGPGGYQFGDYWRMGLPLEILVIAVAVPMILTVWPL